MWNEFFSLFILLHSFPTPSSHHLRFYCLRHHQVFLRLTLENMMFPYFVILSCLPRDLLPKYGRQSPDFSTPRSVHCVRPFPFQFRFLFNRIQSFCSISFPLISSRSLSEIFTILVSYIIYIQHYRVTTRPLGTVAVLSPVQYGLTSVIRTPFSYLSQPDCSSSEVIENCTGCYAITYKNRSCDWILVNSIHRLSNKN